MREKCNSQSKQLNQDEALKDHHGLLKFNLEKQVNVGVASYGRPEIGKICKMFFLTLIL